MNKRKKKETVESLFHKGRGLMNHSCSRTVCFSTFSLKMSTNTHETLFPEQIHLQVLQESDDIDFFARPPTINGIEREKAGEREINVERWKKKETSAMFTCNAYFWSLRNRLFIWYYTFITSERHFCKKWIYLFFSATLYFSANFKYLVNSRWVWLRNLLLIFTAI